MLRKLRWWTRRKQREAELTEVEGGWLVSAPVDGEWVLTVDGGPAVLEGTEAD